MPIDAVEPATANQRMSEGWAYIDVRSPGEFAAGHPPGAVNIPVMFFAPTGPQPNPQFLKAVRSRYAQGDKLLLGCKAGGRSARAASMLEANGFTELTNVLGGFLGGPGLQGTPIPGWQPAGLPVSTDGESWESVQGSLG